MSATKISKRRLIVVLGMHRSGTSAITKSLELLGVGLGGNLHPAGFDNPKGFWEDRECIAINDSLLMHLDSTYDRLGLAWDEIKTDAQVSELKLRATQLILRKQEENNGIWGFKDPRTCRLLGFWKDVFLALECEVCFVIAVRNPASVTASLATRNDIPPEKSYFLWLQHVLPPLSFMKDARRVVVDYDELLANPYSQLVRISAKLGLVLPEPQSSMVKDFESNFLESGLRHACFTEAELALDSRASTIVFSTYNLLHRLSKDLESLESASVLATLKELNARLIDVRPAFDYINCLENERMSLWQAIAERDKQIVNLNQAVIERDGQIVNLNQAVIERDGQIVNLNQAVIERDGQIVNLNQAVIERDKQIVNLNQAVIERDGQIVNLVAERNHILESTSWKITKPFRFIRSTLVNKPYRLIRKIFSDSARQLWLALPIPTPKKLLLKQNLFNNMPSIFRWSQAYRSWAAMNAPCNVEPDLNANSVGVPASVSDKYVPLHETFPPKDVPVRLIAFYLPQFHAITENNEWWGDGFTEWTNVKPAQPQFDRHYQPHIPGELGYYNLLDASVQQRQIELAKLYGIGGFCFYTYWFAGKLLLEKPLENYLSDRSLSLPFCLCWANENWSRRWDGLDSEVLIAQKHSPDDDLAFITHVSQYLRDERYIRIDGKPLLLVYRPSLLPSAKKTAQRWREWCMLNDIGEIYLAYTQSFETVDPSQYGFDAAIEFPPNNSSPPNITETVKPLNKIFGGIVYDWRIFVERSRNYQKTNYKLFRGVCPSWDNTARRKNNGTVFLNSTPQGYQEWLSNAVTETCSRITNPNERLIFVNAWNEWAEGAHLEPDQRYGYAYLQATRNALTGETYVSGKRQKIVLVAHDAYPHGAQQLVLNLAKTLNQGLGFHVDLVCLGDGPLKIEYAKWATVHDLTGIDARGPEAVNLAKRLYESSIRVALVNTTVSGYFLETLTTQGFECVALIHELRGVLNQLNLHGQAASISTHAKKIVFPAIEVAVSFNDVAPTAPDKIVIRPQGLYKRRGKAKNRAEDRVRLRQKLGLPLGTSIILGAGYADHRKGIDLFVEAGLQLALSNPTARWVWIGHWEQGMQRVVEKKLAKFPAMKDRFIFPGLQSDTDIYYGGADVFALTSREDPFPSVVLEALEAEVPVVAFEGAGGFISLLNEGCGRLVAKDDAQAFARTVGDMLEATQQREELGKRGAMLINERFSFRHYAFDLLDLLGIKINRVSVIVPNYNYAQYLPERLLSIIKQTYPIFEIIFLDDCSMDGSVNVAEKILESTEINYRIIINDKNSGSVFRQWQKGVELASGTHIWIAEADDSCCDSFLTEVIGGFKSPNVILSYCESQQMGEGGEILSKNYLDYVADVDQEQWLRPYVRSGKDEIVHSLSVKNTIPNVSAIVFEKNNIQNLLKEKIEEICSYRIAGDWIAYTLALENGKIAFSPKPLNMHRRHSRGVTIGNLNKLQIEEIRRVQKFVAERHDIPAERGEAARKYIQTLSRQFGLAEN